jgi:ATP-binding cassette, subfamily C, bacterial
VILTASPAAGRREAWRLVTRQRRRMIIVTALLALSSAVSLIGPRAVGSVIDQLSDGRSDVDVTGAVAVMIIATVVGALMGYAGTYLGSVVAERAMHDVRSEAMRHAAALPLSTVERVGPGELVSRTTGDVATVATVFEALPWLLMQAASAVLVVVALMALSPVLALVSFVSLPLVLVAARWFLPRSRRVYAAERERMADLGRATFEMAAGAATARQFALGAAHRRRLVDATNDAYVVAMQGTRLRNRFSPAMIVAEYTATIAVLAVGAHLLGGGSLTLGTVAAAALYQVRLAEPIYFGIEYLDEIQKAGAAFSRLVGLRDAAAMPAAPSGAASVAVTAVGSTSPEDPTPATGDVEVADVRFGYRTDRPVLHGVSLTITRGERVAFVGPSGAGKSTLAALIAGVHEVDAGRIGIGGRDVGGRDVGGAGAIDRSELRRRVCLVTQESHLFGPTIADDLRLPRPSAADDDVVAALEAVGAWSWVSRLPAGADEPVGVGGRSLDPAQVQQLALARLIVANPEVVVLDEATAAFDLGTARRVEQSLDAALAGRTVIAVTHRLGEAERFDRIVMIDRGRIVADGPPAVLIAAAGPYRTMRSAAI